MFAVCKMTTSPWGKAWLVAAVSACSFLCVSSSTPRGAKHDGLRLQLMRGLIEGFVSERPDLAHCVGDAGGDLHSLEEGVRDILKHNRTSIVAGFRKLIHTLENLPSLASDCTASAADLKDVVATLRNIKSIKDMGIHIWGDLLRNSGDIRTKLSDALAAYEAKDYVVVGRKIGVVLRLVVVGKAARVPILPPQPPFNRGMRNRTAKQMVRAHPGDQIVVHWNLSPLCTEQFHSWLGDIGLFHVSVGFTNMNSGLVSTIEFAADSFDTTLLVPILNRSDRTMWWNNTASIRLAEGSLDANYWQFRTKLATINASTYNAMLAWLEDAAHQFTKYTMFGLGVVSGASNRDLHEDAFTCFDFAYLALQQLVKFAGPCVFDKAEQGVLRNDIILLVNGTSAPIVEKVPVSAEDAFSFYAAIEGIPDLWSFKYNKTITEMALLAYEQREGRAIYHDSNGQYWSYVPVHPFVTIKKSFVSLPGTCGPKNSILV